MARLLLDENVDARLGALLRERGHDVQAISVDHPAALRDQDVLAIALNERRILVTGDQDFGRASCQRWTATRRCSPPAPAHNRAFSGAISRGNSAG